MLAMEFSPFYSQDFNVTKNRTFHLILKKKNYNWNSLKMLFNSFHLNGHTTILAVAQMLEILCTFE